jgi:hypothetical protein
LWRPPGAGKGNERLKLVVDDLHLVTKGKIDIVVGTHEHQDHLSGFPALAEKFTDKPAGEIWVAWTENESDPLAKDLRGTKDKALTTLSGARMRMKLAGATGEEERLASVLGFFGDGSGPRLRKFGDALSSFRRRSSTASRARSRLSCSTGKHASSCWGRRAMPG